MLRLCSPAHRVGCPDRGVPERQVVSCPGGQSSKPGPTVPRVAERSQRPVLEPGGLGSEAQHDGRAEKEQTRADQRGQSAADTTRTGLPTQPRLVAVKVPTIGHRHGVHRNADPLAYPAPPTRRPWGDRE